MRATTTGLLLIGMLVPFMPAAAAECQSVPFASACADVSESGVSASWQTAHIINPLPAPGVAWTEGAVTVGSDGSFLANASSQDTYWRWSIGAASGPAYQICGIFFITGSSYVDLGCVDQDTELVPGTDPQPWIDFIEDTVLPPYHIGSCTILGSGGPVQCKV